MLRMHSASSKLGVSQPHGVLWKSQLSGPGCEQPVSTNQLPNWCQAMSSGVKPGQDTRKLRSGTRYRQQTSSTVRSELGQAQGCRQEARNGVRDELGSGAGVKGSQQGKVRSGSNQAVWIIIQTAPPDGFLVYIPAWANQGAVESATQALLGGTSSST